MAEDLRRHTPPPRHDSTRCVATGRTYAVALDPTRGALVRVEAGRGVVFEPLAGGPSAVWPVLRRRMVEQLVVHPDGSLLAATLQGLLRVTGPVAPALQKIAGGALCVAVEAGGSVAVGTGRGTIWIDDAERTFNGYPAHESRVEVVLRRDHRIVSGGADARVVQVDLDSEEVTVMRGHVAAITALALGPADQVVSASEVGSVKRWDGPQGGLVWSVRLPGGGPVSALAWMGPWVLASGRDRAVWALHAETGAVEGVWVGHHRAVAGLFPVSDTQFWSWGRDRTLRQWSAPPQADVPPYYGHSEGVRAVHVEPSAIWTAARDGTVRRWQPGAGTPVGPAMKVSTGAVQVLTRRDASTLFFGGTDGAVGILTDRGKVELHRVLHEGPVTCLARPTEALLVSGGADGVLRTWDASRLTPVSARHDHTDRVRCVAVLGDRVVSGSYDTSLVVAPLLGGPPTARLHGHTRPVVGVAATAGHIVSGSLDGTVRSWQPDGTPLAQALGDPDGVVGVTAVGPGRVVTVGRSGQVVLWQVPGLIELDRHPLGIPLDGVGSGQAPDGSWRVVIGDQRGGITELHLSAGGTTAPSATA